MSQENVETIRQIFAAWDADDFEGFVALWMTSWSPADTLQCLTLGPGTDARALSTS